MSTADIQLSVVFGGQYSFEKLQSDYEQTDTLARDYIKNKPDLVNFEAETVTAETVIFDENPTGELAALKLQYSPDEKTLEFGLADGGKLQIGKEMFEEYTNIDTVPLTNGMIVSTAAIPGNRKGIKRTDFTNLASIRSIVGMVTVSSIATNQAGRVTTKGIINDLNTNGWAEGSQLWGNPAVLGGWSGNKPAKPQYAVQIGQVVVASATVGSVELNIAKDVKFSDLADVNGSTNLIDDADAIPKRDADGIIREITVADIKADFKTDTDALYEPLLGFTPENTANKGQANGYASLGADGLVPSNQLPSFVDDVLEFANLAAFPATGEQGKIYVALDTNKTYRWSGSAYIYITSGAVDSVAGKTGIVTLVKADVGLGNVDNTSDANKPVSTAQAIAIATKVGLTGNETIAGVKTFTSLPKIPVLPIDNNDSASKQYADGVGNLTMTAAIDARDKAQQWAESPENAEVEAGKYSARHWAAKAENYSLLIPIDKEEISVTGEQIITLKKKKAIIHTGSLLNTDIFTLAFEAEYTGIEVEEYYLAFITGATIPQILLPIGCRDSLSLLANKRYILKFLRLSRTEISMMVDESDLPFIDEYMTVLEAMPKVPVKLIQDAQSKFVSTLKTAGIWDKLDWLAVFQTETENALINWKNPGTKNPTLATDGAAVPTHTALRGFWGNKANKAFIQSGFSPLANGVNYQLNSASIGFYQRDFALELSNFTMGVNTNTLSLGPRYNGNGTKNGTHYGWLNNATSYGDGSPAGWLKTIHAVVRNNNAELVQYIADTKTVVAKASSVIPAGNLTIFKAGTSGFHESSNVGMAWIGGALSDSDMTTMVNAYESYRHSIGDHNVVIIGDSTSAGAGGGIISKQMDNDTYSCDDLSVGGENINNQKARFEALPATYLTHMDVVFCMAGLNDINVVDGATAISRYQSMINSIRSKIGSANKIVGVTMIPCNRKTFAAYGLLNEAILGGGSTPITGLDAIINTVDTALNDGTGGLAAIYDSGDGLHENAAGSQLIADLYDSKLAELGYK